MKSISLALPPGFMMSLMTALAVIFGVRAQDTWPPSCVGGQLLLENFIDEEMVYPQGSWEKGIEGTVVLDFMIRKDGSAGNIRVAESVNEEIDREAIRIFRKILWHPAVSLGRAVDSPHSLKIRFKTGRYKKAVKKRGYEHIIYPHEPVDTSMKVYEVREVDSPPHPVFSSIDHHFEQFVASRLEYPEQAFRQNIGGTVILRFVVEPSGRISNISAVQHVGGGCTEEAIRIVKLLRWEPGILENTAVRVFYQLEITFDIARYSVKRNIPMPGQIH
ncbi:MAG: energy transducer TonB [Bacteroidales bacterium]|nr:energy transducer TonB [Bacteroidales bacterium]